MTLTEFRKLTAHLVGDRALMCAGVPVGILLHDETGNISIDDDETLPMDPEGYPTVLFREADPDFGIKKELYANNNRDCVAST